MWITQEKQKVLKNTAGMTTIQVAMAAKKEKPHVRYATHRDGLTVGAWDDKLGHWCIVARLCPVYEGIYRKVPHEYEWVFFSEGAHEMYIDGKPTHEESDWTEVKLKE